MAESSTHTNLVQLIVNYIRREHKQVTALGIIDDLPDLLHAEKPNRVGGFVPDVYAFDAPLTTVIIGEAKTTADLETDHSKRQLCAFLTHLSHQEAGILILAVPWQAKRRAQAIIEMLRAETGAASVQAVTLDNVGL